MELHSLHSHNSLYINVNISNVNKNVYFCNFLAQVSRFQFTTSTSVWPVNVAIEVLSSEGWHGGRTVGWGTDIMLKKATPRHWPFGGFCLP